MRNEFATGGNFVAFRLIGTESNRDAIGARVLLQGDGEPGKNIRSQSVRRGEGFLGQSSHWIHFGLGQQRDLGRLEVHWPTGKIERFLVPEAGRFYQLVEGSGEASPWNPPATTAAEHSSRAQAERGDSVDEGNSIHHLLSQPAPVPPLRYTTFTGESGDAAQGDGRPTLLNIWASTCRPCLAELSEWTQRADELTAQGLRVIALSVDGLDQPDQRDNLAAREFIQRIQFSHPAGLASARLVELLQMVNNMVYFHDHRPLPVPTSLLIDGEGRLAAIYKGPVSVDRLLQDVKILATQGEERSRQALPFPGQWIAMQGPHRIGKLAAAMWESGFGREAVELAERVTDEGYREELLKVHWANATHLRSQEGDLADAVSQLQAIVRMDPSHAEALMELGILTARRGNLPEAAELLEQAVQHFEPPDSAAHFNLGKALRELGRNAEALEQLQHSLRLNPSQPQAHELLGHLWVAKKEFEKAAGHFSAAWQLDQENNNHLLNFVSALMQTGELSRAKETLESAIEDKPSAATTRVYLAQVLMQMNQRADAMKQLEKVVELEPKASKVWYQLSQLALQQSEWAKAVSHLRQVAKLVPNDPTVESELAWILATAPVAAIRDGDQALLLAEKAAQATHRRDSRVIDVLAAAYAETGKFELAQQTQLHAIQLLKSSEGSLQPMFRSRLELYKQGQPFRLPAPPERAQDP